MQKQIPGMGAVIGLLGVGAALSLLVACTGAKTPSHGSDALVLGKVDGLNGAPLPPMQFKVEEMGDFPPVGSPKLPMKIELKPE